MAWDRTQNRGYSSLRLFPEKAKATTAEDFP
eukprot:CAMPEP_0115757238 /NCGR_PEP_ID=MMETSP0272-20121206/98329_1 /TAXON_ID=71861 /ORGANISM="Scrippsiella trochoidea, Strain CCMP3099" /LENGTH=30 /DNA_ID= /DNA_START= /DNA_END= /DNA_ORIENTATION=